MANIEVITQINDLLAADDVTIAKTALGVLGAATTGNASIVAADIANDAVTTAKILNLNVTSGKLAVGAAVANIVDNTLPVAKITGLGTAATADTTITGAANGVLKVTSSGDVNLMGAAPTGSALSIGGVFMPDLERLWFLNNTNKADGASIYFSTDHDVNGGELYLASPNRIALLPGAYGGIQIGISSGIANTNMQFAYMQQRGAATAGQTLSNSLPLYFQPAYWNGSVNTSSLAGSIQAVASDTSGNATLNFSIRAVQPVGSGADGSRPLDMQLTTSGVWEVGKAPAWDILSEAAPTQTCSIYKTVQAAKLTLNTASRSLTISGAAAGMRGVIYVKQSGAGSFLLTLPTNSAKISTFALSTAAGLTDRLQWEYDGSYYFWTISNAIEVPLDADVTIFVDATRANITDATQKDALNNLVTSLKASNVAATGTLWSKFSVLYPFVGGNATAHSRNLKSTSYDITWNGTPTHNANGITGDDTAAYGDTNFNMAVLAQDSASIYAYCRTTTPTTTGKYLMGGHNGTTSRTAMLANTVSGNLDYSLNTTADASTSAGNDFSNHLAINRSATGTNGIQTYVGATRALATSTSVAPWSGDMYLLARNSSGTAAAFTSANLAFVAYGSSLVEAEWTAFRAIVDTFQTALSRANA